MVVTVDGPLDKESAYPMFNVDKQIPCGKDTHDFYGILFQDQYSSVYHISIYTSLNQATRRYDQLEHFESIDPVELDRINNQYRQLAKFTPVRTDDSGFVHKLRFVKAYRCNNRETLSLDEDDGSIEAY